jgi:Tfp pilus assembly protein PilF
MKHEFVDRILTTNFDPLVIRACALVGLFPAVYDFAASQTFKAGNIPRQAIVYLHGQRSGFVLLHTQEEVERHSERLKPVFDEAGQSRVWLVVGYSGSDPVFDRLVDFQRFDNELYWVSYPEDEPPPHVRDRLLAADKDAYYVDGYDADSFFVALLRQLECFPPDFVGRPFSYLDGLIEALAPYEPSTETSRPDFTRRARLMIGEAIAQYETGEEAETERRAEDLLLAGKLDELSSFSAEETHVTPEVALAVAWGHVTAGDRFGEEALAKVGAEADALFTQAYQEYNAALSVKPDMHEALNNWGNALTNQATRKDGVEADQLFNAAYNKYEAALAIKPNRHVALNNWGSALTEQARLKEGAEADQLFTAAYDKYGAALALKPDLRMALSNWGLGLLDQARLKQDAAAERLFNEAEQKFLGAEALEPGKASYDLACLHALRGNGDEARRWLERSKELGTLPTPEKLAADTDLDGIRDEEWFKDLVAEPASQ